MIHIDIDRTSATAAPALAFLSFVGTGGWHRPTREHGALHGEQLLTPRFLARVASLL
jgi:hypothetical protein